MHEAMIPIPITWHEYVETGDKGIEHSISEHLAQFVRHQFKADGKLDRFVVFLRHDETEDGWVIAHDPIPRVLLDAPSEMLGDFIRQMIPQLKIEVVATVNELWLSLHEVGDDISRVRPSQEPNRHEGILIQVESTHQPEMSRMLEIIRDENGGDPKLEEFEPMSHSFYSMGNLSGFFPAKLDS